MGLRDLLKPFAPKALVSHVRHGRAEAEHQRLLRFNQELPQELLADTRLFAHRELMLEAMPKGGKVAEIGVAQGAFSAKILSICAPDELVLIDPWDADIEAYSENSYTAIQRKMAAEIEAGQVTLARGYSGQMVPNYADDYFDWVYVDGAHDYASVKEDLALCARVVKPGGVIAGHDYLRWVSGTDRYGVLEAVNEFMADTKSPMVFLTNQYDKHDSFAFRLNK
ncbi:MAG: class I SAM-dependent methyltransferase [Pseudomonadota bacterium]